MRVFGRASLLRDRKVLPASTDSVRANHGASELRHVRAVRFRAAPPPATIPDRSLLGAPNRLWIGASHTCATAHPVGGRRQRIPAARRTPPEWAAMLVAPFFQAT